MTSRQQAKADNLARIKALALEQLAESGAGQLSLRAIARELDLVSSAIYRYFAGRDELITALVVDAYDDLADHLVAAGGRRRDRWVATALALRAWALAQPHRFALIYGSAIPGYAAPTTTVEPAGRVIQCFFDAAPAAQAPPTRRPLTRTLDAQLQRTGEAFGSDLDHPTVLAHTAAFAQLVGMLTLELNGHFVGGFEPADDVYLAVVDQAAESLGL